MIREGIPNDVLPRGTGVIATALRKAKAKPDESDDRVVLGDRLSTVLSDPKSTDAQKLLAEVTRSVASQLDRDAVERLSKLARKAFARNADAEPILNSLAETVQSPADCRRLIDDLTRTSFVTADSPAVRAAIDVAVERSRGRLFGVSTQYRSQVLQETFRAIAHGTQLSAPAGPPELQRVHHAILQRRVLENVVLDDLVGMAQEHGKSLADSAAAEAEPPAKAKAAVPTSGKGNASRKRTHRVATSPKSPPPPVDPDKIKLPASVVLASADIQAELASIRERIADDEQLLESYRAVELTPNRISGVGFRPTH